MKAARKVSHTELAGMMAASSLACTVAGVYEDSVNRKIEVTACMVTPLCMWLGDAMQSLETVPNTPFKQKLMNRVRAVVREADRFDQFVWEHAVKSPELVGLCDSLYQCLDAWMRNISGSDPDVNPNYDLRRRSLMRYHDPYTVAVEQCTEAFSDGYCKGYFDGVTDVQRKAEKSIENGRDTVSMKVEKGSSVMFREEEDDR